MLTLQYYANNNKERQVDEGNIKGEDRDMTNKGKAAQQSS